MYAIIQSGGKQHAVHAGKRINVEKLAYNPGETFVCKDILLVSDGKESIIGQPLVKDHVVEIKLLDHIRNDKIIVFKKKRRKGYKRKHGHRQDMSSIEILSISKLPSQSSETKNKKIHKEEQIISKNATQASNNIDKEIEVKITTKPTRKAPSKSVTSKASTKDTNK